MVSETQYGRWAAEAADNGLGTTASGAPVVQVMRARAPLTLWLVLVGLVGGYSSGVVLGLVGAARVRRAPDILTSAAAVLAGALPIAALATAFAPAHGSRPAWAPWSWSWCQRQSFRGTSAPRRGWRSTRSTRARLVLSARAPGASPRSFRSSSVATLSLLGVDLTTIVTIAFVMEHALDLSGLASVTLLAVATRDVAWLMALALALATALGLAQIASDSLLSSLDPRVRLGLSRKRGAIL